MAIAGSQLRTYERVSRDCAPLPYSPRWSQGADERLDLVQVFAGAS
jgi:hypothetical protein